MAWAGGRRLVGMRGPRTRAWGRMDTLLPGRWRRRKAEELQVPGDVVSPPGPGRVEWDGGVLGAYPTGLRVSPGASPGRGTAGVAPAPSWRGGWGQGAGPRRCPALSPSGRACAETREPGAACAALPEGPDPVSLAVSLTRARPRDVRAAAPESRPHVLAPGWAGWGCRVSRHARVECFEGRDEGEVR